jgi:hypothetical protein
MPSIAFIAIRTGSQTGRRKNSHASSNAATPTLTTAPMAIEAASAERVT